MSELHPPTPTSHVETEPDLHEERVVLEGQSAGFVLDGLKPLYPKRVAMQQQGIPGDVLALIELPKGGKDETPPKQIAIVDYGHTIDAAHPVPAQYDERGEPVPMLGKVKSRYGLRPWKYAPEGRLGAPVELPVGASLSLGTDTDGTASDKLGLRDLDITEPGNEKIAPEHCRIAIDDGVMGIFDVSGSFTTVILAGEQHVSPADIPKSQQLGSLALLGI